MHNTRNHDDWDLKGSHKPSKSIQKDNYYDIQHFCILKTVMYVLFLLYLVAYVWPGRTTFPFTGAGAIGARSLHFVGG